MDSNEAENLSVRFQEQDELLVSAEKECQWQPGIDSLTSYLHASSCFIDPLVVKVLSVASSPNLSCHNQHMQQDGPELFFFCFMVASAVGKTGLVVNFIRGSRL